MSIRVEPVANHGLMGHGGRRILRADGAGRDARRQVRVRGGPSHDSRDPTTTSPFAQSAGGHTDPSRARTGRTPRRRGGREAHHRFAGPPALAGRRPLTRDPFPAVGSSRRRYHAVRDSIALPTPHCRLTRPHLRSGRLRSGDALWDVWQLRHDHPPPRPRRLGARVRDHRLDVPHELASAGGTGRATALPWSRYAPPTSSSPQRSLDESGFSGPAIGQYLGESVIRPTPESSPAPRSVRAGRGDASDRNRGVAIARLLPAAARLPGREAIVGFQPPSCGSDRQLRGLPAVQASSRGPSALLPYASIGHASVGASMTSSRAAGRRCPHPAGETQAASPAPVGQIDGALRHPASGATRRKSTAKGRSTPLAVGFAGRARARKWQGQLRLRDTHASSGPRSWSRGSRLSSLATNPMDPRRASTSRRHRDHSQPSFAFDHQLSVAARTVRIARAERELTRVDEEP